MGDVSNAVCGAGFLGVILLPPGFVSNGGIARCMIAAPAARRGTAPKSCWVSIDGQLIRLP